MDRSDLNCIARLKIDPPRDPGSLAKWFECTDAVEFLEETTSGSVPVYVSGPGVFVYATLVSEDRLAGDHDEDVMGWNFGVSSGWGYGVRHSANDQTDKISVFPPIEGTDTQALEGSEPLVFLRHFEGRQGKKSYVEVNQRFTHVVDAHWTESRKAFCSLDENGDYIDIVNPSESGEWLLCTVRSDALDFYMAATQTALIRVFDITRLQSGLDAPDELREESRIKVPTTGIVARRVKFRSSSGEYQSSFLRGFQIIRVSDPDAIRCSAQRNRHDRQYASFIIHDWKNQRIVEWSSDPEQLANYFVKSPLPFETSPVFFRPEVLLKYKQHPDKYTLKDRSISCRGAWSLETYDINEAGQVHSYIVYLSRLPYSEQLYWKSFNEPPKAGLSTRAIATDFRGEWWSEIDPLQRLKEVLRAFPLPRHAGVPVAIWRPVGGSDVEQALGNLHYVVTDSGKEWRDSILELSKIVIDGLDKAAFRRLARVLGCDDSQLGSLKLLEKCLQTLGVAEDLVQRVHEPLTGLWDARSSKGAAHGGGEIPKGDLRQEYRRRVGEIGEAMEILADLIRKGLLNTPSSGVNAS